MDAGATLDARRTRRVSRALDSVAGAGTLLIVGDDQQRAAPEVSYRTGITLCKVVTNLLSADNENYARHRLKRRRRLRRTRGSRHRR